MAASLTSPSSPTPAPDLSIIVVSWNVRDLLRNCLSTIEAQRGDLALDVIVVDGGSADASSDMVATSFPWVHLIALNENVGFPRANNIGLTQATGRYVLLLNPDTELRSGALAQMVRFLDENADVGVLGPQLLNPDGSVQSSRRRFPTLLTAFFESTWLQPYAPASVLSRYYALDAADDAVSDVDWVVGASLMIRWQVIGEVGELDEGYFMYSEELDWCRRVKDAGWRVVYFPEAQVVHHVGKSSDQAVIARHVNFQRAKLRYFRKFHGQAATGLLRSFLLMSYAGQLVIEASKAAVRHRPELRRQRVRAYWQVLRSGLPPAGN